MTGTGDGCRPALRLRSNANAYFRLDEAGRRAAIGTASALIAVTLVAGCAGSLPPRPVDGMLGVRASPRITASSVHGIPKGGGTYKIGKPYTIAGRWYYPHEDNTYDRTGIASWYGADFHGRYTANGEIYDMVALTAAHRTLPLPSYAYVTNVKNGRTILVRINDRGPYAGDRIIDLSRASAQALGLERKGLGHVRVQYAGRAPLNGDDVHERRFLAAQRWAPGGNPPAVAGRRSPLPRQASAQDEAWDTARYRIASKPR